MEMGSMTSISLDGDKEVEIEQSEDLLFLVMTL